MVMGYELLQKKLQEIATQLEYAAALPLDTPYHQLLSIAEGLDARFTFLKNLQSAEIQSQSQKPHELDHIAQVYENLKSIFKDWCSFRISTRFCTESGPNNFIFVEHKDSGGSSPDHDNASRRSYTESCLNDDRSLDSHSSQDPGIFLEGVIQEEQAVAKVKAEGCGQRERKKEESRLWLSGNGVCAVLSGVVMISVAVVGVVMADPVIANFCASCCYGSNQVEGFQPPT
ncbi:hypothetical protein NE237_027876 [Protea cynaroides]|uniref:DUF7610 domain-containing protein n=1 Tax=Protea cynaroides TaxID=273540 RepID=A0A9Q0GPC8_9MAGN|nr:hypothetical protein NE237_027876 [Protea cynaroides]